jgi:hypothetical protein
MKTFPPLLLLLCVSLTACNDQGRSEFKYADWDTDQNEIIDNREFDNVFNESPYFDQWNQNDDQYISRSEFYEGYVRMLNRETEGELGPDNWDAVFNSYFGGLDFPREYFEEWDEDGNDRLGDEEIRAALNDTDYFDKFDQDGDGQIDENEFAESVFTTWDTNNDGFVQAEEYAKWYNKYARPFGE